MPRVFPIALLVLLACGSAEPVPLRFAITEFAPDRDFEPAISADVAEEGVQVAGALQGSLCASAPSAVATRDRQRLTLRVNFGRRSAVPCPAVPRALRYDATITDLEPGSYELHVVHVTRGLKANRQEMLVQRVRLD